MNWNTASSGSQKKKSLKNRLYNQLVRKVPQICQRYEGYVNADKQHYRRHRGKSLYLLLKLNIAYHIFKVDLANEKDGLKRAPYYKGCESALSFREPPEKLAERLLSYDVISFDIFDTLIFRPFAKPADLFHLVGEKQNYLDFANLRVLAEQGARSEKLKSGGNEEITLADIYDYLELHMGIPAQQGLRLEFETEKELCYANPYLRQVFQRLMEHRKQVVLVSDMYLPKSMMAELLKSCGYDGFADIFVSCDYGKSKQQGDLYDIVRASLGHKKTYLHIGDNPYSDQKQAKNHNFEALHYSNVNAAGQAFRCSEMSCIVGSAYQGVVNAHFHSGLRSFTLPYEYGYAYGGLFALGYCSFIHDYACKNAVDKILFLARDGDILKRIYDMLYTDCKTEYVYWSRLAGAKLSADRYKHDYFRRFVYHKVNSGVTVRQALHAMELDFLAEQFEGDTDEKLDAKAAAAVEIFLLQHWESVLACYAPQAEAGKLYYQKELHGCKKVCAVDIGWAGSGANSLSYLVNNVWNLDCKVVGLIAGTNSKSNLEPDASEAMLQSGKMAAYLFSQSHNRNYWSSHNPGLGHNIAMEMLLSSTTPSFLGFALDDGKRFRLRFAGEETENHEVIKEIQKGILNFVADYTAHFQQYPYLLNISGADAYAPIQFAAANGGKYFHMVLKNCSFQVNIGDGREKECIGSLL